MDKWCKAVDQSIDDTYKRVAKALSGVEKTPVLQEKWYAEFLWALQHIVLSILLIWIVHKTFKYFKSQLTVPKVKDLVNKPMTEYGNMYRSMEMEVNDYKPEADKSISTQEQIVEKKEMKSKLKEFLANVTDRPELSISNFSSGNTNIPSADYLL